jgi:prevent-host-death family protein
MAKRPSSIGSRELKTRLGTYLERVRRGETIIVTDRGTPVAELRPVQMPEDPTEAALERMQSEGLITRGVAGEMAHREPIRLPPGVTVSALIRADRDERGF